MCNYRFADAVNMLSQMSDTSYVNTIIHQYNIVLHMRILRQRQVCPSTPISELAYHADGVRQRNQQKILVPRARGREAVHPPEAVTGGTLE